MIRALSRLNMPDRMQIVLSVLSALNVVLTAIIFRAPHIPGVMSASIILPLLGIPLLAPPRARAFEAALPINARTLFIVRIFPMFALMAFPLVAACALEFWSEPVDVGAAYLVVVLSAVMLLVALPSLVRPRDAARPSIAIVASTEAALGLAIWILYGQVTFAALASIVGIAAVSVVTLAWRRTPASYVFESQTSPTTKSWRRWARRSESGHWWKPLVLSAAPMRTWPMLAFLPVISAMGTGDLYLFMFVGVVLPTAQLRWSWLGTLPVSTRARTTLILGPSILFALGLLILGSHVQLPGLFAERLSRGAPSTSPDFDVETLESMVPFEFWQTSIGDSAPRVVAPWGESVKAGTLRVFSKTYFNPYSVVRGNTRRFADWQLQRATTAVYGVPISRAEYKAMKGHMPSRRTASARVQSLYYGLLFVAVLFVALLHLAAASNIARRRRGLGWAISIVAFAPMFAILAFQVTHMSLGIDGLFSFLRLYLLRFSEGPSIAWTGALLLTLLAAVALARCAEWCVARSDASGLPPAVITKHRV